MLKQILLNIIGLLRTLNIAVYVVCSVFPVNLEQNSQQRAPHTMKTRSEPTNNHTGLMLTKTAYRAMKFHSKIYQQINIQLGHEFQNKHTAQYNGNDIQ